MNYQKLQEKLAIKAGKVTISHNTLTPNISDFLKFSYANQAIVITGAEPGQGDGEVEVVALSGITSFLNIADLPVTARFSLDDMGNVRALFTYSLRGELPKPNDWIFSRSFPALPTVLNYETEVQMTPEGELELLTEQTPYLDALYLYNSYFVVSTHDQPESEFGVPLSEGINFVSQMKPQGMLGVLEHTLGDGAPLTCYGAIRLPKTTEVTLPLKPGERVWDRPDAPGIHLQAPLDIDFKLGNLIFNQAYLRIYSPPSTDWLLENSAFQPTHGYVGKLQIPSADIEVELSADLEWGMPEALLYGKCEGITLGKLSQLMDMAGTGKLTDKLPKQIQKAVDALEKLELMYVTLNLSLDGLTPTVSSVSFTVGLPDLNWQVWDDHFEVSSISCRFEIENPFGTLSPQPAMPMSSEDSFSVTVMGTIEIEGVPVSISAKSADNFTLYATLAGQQTIPLEKLMKRYVPGVPAPSDLTVDGMSVTIAPGQFYAMSAALAGKPNPWVIDVGPSKLIISDVVLNFIYPTGGPVSGSFGGAIAFGDDVILVMNYDIPGSFIIRADFPQVKLSQIIRKLCNQKVALPGDFDLAFEQSSALIQKQGNDYVFQFATQVENVGSFAFEARKVSANNTWGFAAGMDLSAGNPSQLPGLSALGVFEKAFKLEKFLLVVSSFDNANFQFPDLAQFNNPQISAKNIALPAQAGGVMAGMYLFAQWRINTQDPQQKLLKGLLGLEPTLSVALQIGENPAQNAKLYVSYTTKIQGHPFDCQFGAQLQNGNLGLFLTGTLTTKIQKQLLTFDVVALFVKSGAFLSGTMTGTVKFEGIQLSNLALVIGVNWGGIPSLGLAATISAASFNSSIAVFFDSTDPSKSLLAGAVSELSLKDVTTDLAGVKTPDEIADVLDGIGLEGARPFTIRRPDLAEALDNLQLEEIAPAFQEYGNVTIPSSQESALLVVNKRGQSWNLTDLQNNMRHYQLEKTGNGIKVSLASQVYCVPQDSQVGTLRFQKGFFLSGTLNLLGLKSTSVVEINPNKGIATESYLDDALVIFKPRFFKLSDVEGKKGPRLSIATFSRPEVEEKEFRKPHIYLDGYLSLVGLVNICYVRATTKGLAFSISQEKTLSLPSGSFSGKVNMAYVIDGLFDSLKNINASGDVNVSLSGKADLGKLGFLDKTISDLGKVGIDIAVAGGLDMGYDGSVAYVQFSGSFEFQNIRRRFKKELEASNADMTQAGKWVYDEIMDILKELVKTAEKWIQGVKDGVIAIEQGADQMANVLKGGYGKTAEEAFKLVRSTGKDFKEIGQAFKKVYGSSTEDIGKFMKGLGAGSEEIAGTLKDTFNASPKKVAQVLDGLKMSPDEIANAMKSAYKQSAKEVTQTLRDIGKSPKDVAKALKNTFKLSAKDTGKLLKDSFDLDKGDMKSVMKGAGYSAKEVDKFVDSTYKKVEKVFKKIKG